MAQDPIWEEVDTSVPETWDFEENPVLIGTYRGSVLARMLDPQDPGSKRLVERVAYRIKPEDGPEVSVWESLILRRAFGQLTPPKLIKIEYEGKADREGGKTEKLFKVAVAK